MLDFNVLGLGSKENGRGVNVEYEGLKGETER
jgi:hypothetical protein